MTWGTNISRNALSLLIYFLLHCTVTGNYSGCPEYTLLEPCSCIHRPGTNILLCAGLKDPAALDQVLESSPEWAFHTLFVCQSNFKNIPSSSLISRKTKTILIANSNMTSLFDKQPDPANAVEVVHINNVWFQEGIAWELFGTLKRLQYFNLQFGDIPVLERAMVDNFSSGTKQFFLSNTRTKRLEAGVFGSLKELLEIKIRHGDIVTLERSAFSIPAKLTSLDFTSNQIEFLPDDIFSDMPDLRVVFLGENKISRISNTLLEFVVDHLEFLNLIGNPLNCDCDFKLLAEKDKRNIDGNCIQPENNQGVSLFNLTTTDFNACS